ncbi:histidinol-phosphatase, inositol monophosphatase family [Monaibacterium marinum]|uniref:Histidinol-phosphatase, inositol monophosphatase family n=1 Tax=Pontivivens marinum TaxID=1690039 RepID=A0A2C9CM58_9RHOB|nr:inositol monophosphatase family protein [Monaibacterium marinum]SOH92275.1 histidinol-phosphatase, inositol monophosphatase family [Monaibacterium marinum]
MSDATTLNANLEMELREVGHALADAARGAILPYFRSLDMSVDNKLADGFDPVTAADRAAERAMRVVLANLRPDDGVEGEEEAPTPSRSGFTWVLDPIDGTRAFLAGTATWGVLIAVNAGAAPVFGIVDQPYMDERFVGGFGRAELHHGGFVRPLNTRPARTLDQALLMTTFPEVGTAEERAAFERVRDQVQLTRYGLDCYGYALIALGSIDLVIEAGLNSYDIQGPMAVIEAAGGIVTDWQGGPVHRGGQVIAAANVEIHAAALELLRG